MTWRFTMPNMKTIDIVKQNKNGKDVVGPVDNPTQVRKDDVVIFSIPPNADRADSSITFKDGKSPFGPAKVEYGVQLRVVVDQGRFKYDCKMKIGGQTFETDSGGEMEIIGGN
jgi:hypothetical protein